MLMNRLVISFAFVVLSCQSGQQMTTPSETPRVEVTTDGGFAGRGVGGIVIDGDAATASDLARKCDSKLTDAQRTAVARDVRTFRPASGAPAHPDQIGYTMKAGDVSAQWHGEEPPPSAAPLFRTVWSIRETILAGCK